MINKKEFEDKLNLNICPFCDQKLNFYDGFCGYEALKCFDCHLTVDNQGIHLE